METIAKLCFGCDEWYYGPSVNALFCSDGCFNEINDQLVARAKVNREQCEKHDAEQRAAKLARGEDEILVADAELLVARAK